MDFRRRETFLACTGNRTPDRPVPGLVAIRNTVLLQSLVTSKEYSLTNIIRVIKSIKMRWARFVARVGERRGAERVLVGRCEGRRPVGRRRRRWEGNIKMDFEEMSCRGMEWIDLAQDMDKWRAVVNAVM